MLRSTHWVGILALVACSGDKTGTDTGSSDTGTTETDVADTDTDTDTDSDTDTDTDTDLPDPCSKAPDASWHCYAAFDESLTAPTSYAGDSECGFDVYDDAHHERLTWTEMHAIGYGYQYSTGEQFEYDALGYVTDDRQDQVDFDGVWEHTETTTYGDFGDQHLETQFEKDGLPGMDQKWGTADDRPADGDADWIETWDRDSDTGAVNMYSKDSDGDGTPNYTETYTYVAAGPAAGLKDTVTFDDDGDGTPDRLKTYTYDAGGNISRIVYDTGLDGTPDLTYVYHWATGPSALNYALFGVPQEVDGYVGTDPTVQYRDAYTVTRQGTTMSFAEALDDEDTDSDGNPNADGVIDYKLEQEFPLDYSTLTVREDTSPSDGQWDSNYTITFGANDETIDGFLDYGGSYGYDAYHEVAAFGARGRLVSDAGDYGDPAFFGYVDSWDFQGTCASQSAVNVSGAGLPVNLSGRSVWAQVVRDDDGAIFSAPASGTVAADGSFSVAVPGAVEEGESYHVDLLVDVDGSGDCSGIESVQGTFRSPMFTATSGDQAVTIDVTADANTDACDTF